MEELIFFGLFGTFAVASGVFATAWLAARRRARTLDRLLTRVTSSDDRLDLMDQRLEDIAARLEQLARGQEFLGKLLSRGAGRSRAGAEPRPLTPH